MLNYGSGNPYSRHFPAARLAALDAGLTQFIDRELVQTQLRHALTRRSAEACKRNWNGGSAEGRRVETPLRNMEKPDRRHVRADDQTDVSPNGTSLTGPRAGLQGA